MVGTAAAAVAAWLSMASPSRRLRGVVGAALLAAVFAVGAFMVYLGAHWASDVLAGWALGAAVGAGAGRIVGLGGRRSRSPSELAA